MRSEESLPASAGQLPRGPPCLLFSPRASGPLVGSPRGWLPAGQRGHSSAPGRSVPVPTGPEPRGVEGSLYSHDFLDSRPASPRWGQFTASAHLAPRCPVRRASRHTPLEAGPLRAGAPRMAGPGCASLQLVADAILLSLCSSQPLCTEPQVQVKRSQKKYLG